MYHDTIVMPKQPAEAAIKNNTAHKIKTIQIKSYTHAIILSIIYIYICNEINECSNSVQNIFYTMFREVNMNLNLELVNIT